VGAKGSIRHSPWRRGDEVEGVEVAIEAQNSVRTSSYPRGSWKREDRAWIGNV